VAATALPIPVRHRGNTGGANGYLSAVDDRLGSIHLRAGRAWVAHTIGATDTGAAGNTRNGIRWYEVGALDTTPAVIQSGTLVVMSEFGRKAQENGSQGTDHGHGNVMFVLGGSTAGGQVMTQWPGMSTQQLYQGQDLQVTIDYRDILSEIVSRRLGNAKLDVVFPGYTPTFRGAVV